MKRLNVVGDEIDFETFCRGFRTFMGGEREEERATKFDEVQINQYREASSLKSLQALSLSVVDIQAV